MTAEEIRAEAIERLRTALKPVAEDSCCTVCRDPYAPYIDGEVNIGALVDALGDLLPTGEEVSTCFPDEPAADEEAMRRYVTDWQELNA